MIEELWKKAVAFHGHACPGLAIGVRACGHILAHPDFAGAPYGSLCCVTENDACGVDAIQCLVGCSVGKGNLVFRGTGKHAYSFFNRENGKGLRLYLRGKADAGMSREAWQSRLLSAPLEELFTFSQPAIPCPAPARKFPTIVCEHCGEGASEHAMRLQEGKLVCPDCFRPYVRGW